MPVCVICVCVCPSKPSSQAAATVSVGAAVTDQISGFTAPGLMALTHWCLVAWRMETTLKGPVLRQHPPAALCSSDVRSVLVKSGSLLYPYSTRILWLTGIVGG